MLLGVDEVFLVPPGAENFDSGFVQSQCAVGVVPEMVGEDDGKRSANSNLTEMLGAAAGAGIDEYGAQRTAHGVYAATVLVCE